LLTSTGQLVMQGTLIRTTATFFLWDHQKEFCILNSRYRRAFAMSPFGSGVRGVPRSKSKGIPRGLDEIDIALKVRLTANTGRIRTAITEALHNGKLDDARQILLNYYWPSSLLMKFFFNRGQYQRDESGKIWKGRWGLDEIEGWQTLTGIRNRILMNLESFASANRFSSSGLSCTETYQSYF